jgi:hypothetical protein
MAKWVVWNNSANRLEVNSVFPNQTDANNAIYSIEAVSAGRSGSHAGHAR